ncbi:MAG: hypothetical protein QG562_701 [Patescibacteria group bacterium]|nr:hypothetical protein [Patescibacteria group bacterium]MDQ5958882.1 hypothetical protein [Patescibacteria group bacterium]
MNKLKSKLVKDGNSMAVRLPKAALTMSGISGQVDLIIKDGEIIIKKPKTVRSSWVKAISLDKPVNDTLLNDWDGLVGEALD